VFFEIFREAWAALGRNPVRSLLTMTGIAWGIVAVTLLLSYGSGFRNVLMYTFEVFGKGAVVCWPGTTSEQAGGERAGKVVRFEQEDADWVKAQSPLIKRVTRETVRWKGITHDERLADTAIRGVYPEYGELRNEVPVEAAGFPPKISPSAAGWHSSAPSFAENCSAARPRSAKPCASMA
jgi:putative ABC transport system permease protein